MTKVQQEPHWLQIALEEAGHEPHSYSGRGMYGDKCLAISGDNIDLMQLGFELGRNCDDGDEMPRSNTDSMGRGIVVYWQEVQFVEEQDDEENEEENG